MASSSPDSPTRPAAGAIFLSYAREDADAARRIADALRGFGVEVWFDQSELRGGDAWDQKIRNQIKTCALFLPIVSAQTQARTEGYFRREWLLAVDRTRDMASGLAFIVPVVIDDTRESDAAVPEEFMRYQWTRLAQGVPSPQFLDQVKRLLESPRNAASSTRVGVAPMASSAAPKKNSPWPGAAVAAVVIAGVVAFVVLRPTEKTPSPATAAAIKSAASTASNARQLAAKAWALWEKQDDATRDDWALADQLCQQAVGLDPTDGDVAAAQAQMSLAFIIFGFDASAARYEAARTQAERAVRLAPDSNEAQFALANYYRRQTTTRDEGVRILRQLVERLPTDKRVLRTLASGLRGQKEYQESLIYSDRANALPGGDPIALFGKEEALRLLDREAEGENAIDQALAVRPTPAGYLKKLLYVLHYRGDLDEARALIEKLPAPSLLEDWGAAYAFQVWLWRREPEKVIAMANAVPKEYLEKGVFSGPKAYYTGLARQLTGNTAAAHTDWQAARQVVEQRLKAQPNSIELLGWRALLLAALDERTEGEQALHVYEQLVITSGTPEAHFSDLVRIKAALGHTDEAIDIIISSETRRWPVLRYDPAFDSLRKDPRFAAWLKAPEPIK